jgi:SAM-dependent methyltransferase
MGMFALDWPGLPGGGFVDYGQIIQPRRELVNRLERRTEPVSDPTNAVFKDHFSGHADRYGAFRPTYPSELFSYLASLSPAHDLAWDCATGNGQAALALIPFFGRVVATDASSRQVAQALPNERIEYLVATAERTPLPDASVNLVTVAQALHWFDLAAFYAEVKRVTRPGGILAAWCYELHEITPEVDLVISRLYFDILGDDWPPERRLVEEGYRTIPFSFDEIEPPRFSMVAQWDLDRLLGYLGTWSAVVRHRDRCGSDPLDQIRANLKRPGATLTLNSM